MQNPNYDEAALFQKYKPFIFKLVHIYLAKFNVPVLSNHLDDLIAEASVAFLIATRKMDIQDCTLTKYQRSFVKMAIFSALRVYLWGFYNTANTNPHLPIDRTAYFSDLIAEDSEVPAIDADFTEDDYSYIEVEDFLSALTPRDQQIIELLIAGYSSRMIEKLINISKSTVANRLHYLQAFYLKKQKKSLL